MFNNYFCKVMLFVIMYKEADLSFNLLCMFLRILVKHIVFIHFYEIVLIPYIKFNTINKTQMKIFRF